MMICNGPFVAVRQNNWYGWIVGNLSEMYAEVMLIRRRVRARCVLLYRAVVRFHIYAKKDEM